MGVVALSFAQAQEKARQWFSRRARSAAGMEEVTGPFTVAHALREYLVEFGEDRSHYATARGHIEVYIVPALGRLEVEMLTAPQIRSIHRQIAKTPARLRTRRGEPQKHRPPPETPDEQRRRRATANKVLTTLKAALNRAFRDGKVASDTAWRTVQPFRGVDAPKVRYLTDEEVARLVNTCDREFRPMVQAAVLTGARYGELCRLTVGDLDLKTGTAFVVAGKSEKSRHVVLSDEAHMFFERLTAGRGNEDLLFRRADGKPWGKSHQRRRLAAACSAAFIEPEIGFHILRHTHASRLAMRGVPMSVIAAQLGHADTRMTERHYAHLSPSYVADTIRQSFGPLGIVEQVNVTALRR